MLSSGSQKCKSLKLLKPGQRQTVKFSVGLLPAGTSNIRIFLKSPRTLEANTKLLLSNEGINLARRDLPVRIQVTDI